MAAKYDTENYFAWIYNGSQKFHRNYSISYCFQDKCIFVFYAEIQDGCQIWQETDLWQKVKDDSVSTLGAKNLVKFTLFCTVRDKLVFAFYAGF